MATQANKSSFLTGERLAGALAALLLACAVGAALYVERHPAPPTRDEDPSAFGTSRARAHLSRVAAEPRPLNSAAHDKVRDYILAELAAQGLRPEVQAAEMERRRGGPARVENIVAVLGGTEPGGPALMLAAHYDSVEGSPGASDDGSGVVTLLETLRALRAGPPLRRDVVFLFTDGEESGLLGAKAFVGAHPLSRRVGLVLNFEARGTCGPVYMFETSERNGALVAEFAKAAPRPYASSLAYTVYKLLPNDTDLTVFKGAGMAGLNFAYVGCSANYHRPADSVSNLDADSLRHMGSYAPALARHFADGPLDFSGAGRAVYFDLFGLALVHYSQTWVTPLAVGAALLFALVLFYGFRKKLLTWRGTALGFFGLLAAAACALALSAAFKSLTAGARGRVELLALALAVLTLLVAVGVYALLLRRAGVASLCAGALLWWLVPAVGVSRDFPGASYLYLWPLLCGTLALALLLWAEARRLHPFALLSALCLLLLPPVALLARTADGLVQALGLRMPFVLVALVLTGSALLVPFLTFAPRARRAHTPPHTDS